MLLSDQAGPWFLWIPLCPCFPLLGVRFEPTDTYFFMSLGLLAMLMGRETLVQPPRLPGSSLRVPGLAGGGAGGAAEEGLGWQETQDLPGGGLSDASASGIWHGPSEVGGCRAWGGSQTRKPWQAGVGTGWTEAAGGRDKAGVDILAFSHNQAQTLGDGV